MPTSPHFSTQVEVKTSRTGVLGYITVESDGSLTPDEFFDMAIQRESSSYPHILDSVRGMLATGEETATFSLFPSGGSSIMVTATLLKKRDV